MVASTAAAATIVVENAWVGSVAEVTTCVVSALVVLRLEMQRRVGVAGGNAGLGGFSQCKQLLQHCAPELAGLVACLALAALLRARGDADAGISEAEIATWDEIKAQWPILLTADTLLSMQAMLRVVVFFSAVLRAGTGPVPLGDEAAAFSLGAQLMRGLLLARSTAYMLDGPVGGKLPATCEIVAIPLLAALGAFGTLRRNPLPATIAVGCVAWLATRHYLSLGGDALADQSFIAAHILDLVSALAYLARSLLIGGNDEHEPARSTAIGFTHVLMAAQQSLATYYFLRAFDAAPELVGAGLPFMVIHIGCAVQLGVYLAAAAVFVAEHFEKGGTMVAVAPGHAAPQPAVLEF
mmetsp:Transcript_121372/g.343460  ORF Transcript_121372/g.343460 Transcript_121372/m.343460 type:complete len:353 (+) Transcript_121372:148-1206(+)